MASGPIADDHRIDATDNKPNLSFWQIWTMSFGFLGIQYGFGLQQANMSAIYRYLNADEAQIPALWLAGPITGLIVQPIIGALSDRTWIPRWGRRKPFFLIGAIMTSIALIFMPNSGSLWMAAGTMWVLDTGLNITMEPFRAFVGDKLNSRQRTLGFAMQSFFVGLGQTLANLMPYILPIFGLALAGETAIGSAIPDYVRYSFYIGAAAVLITVFVTVNTTPEYPPEDMQAFIEAKKKESIWTVFTDVFKAFREMPLVMKQLWWVKFFTWYSLPLMWQFLTLAVARYAYNAPDAKSNPAGFEEAGRWGSLCFALFNVGCFGISFLLPGIAKRITRRGTHALFLSIGALGFLLLVLFPTKYNFLYGMGLVGLAWGSILSMPYVLLSNSVPAQRMGVYMGLFNGFIVVPQIIQMTTYGWLHKNVFDQDPLKALMIACVGLFLAAASCMLIKEPKLREPSLLFDESVAK